MNSKVIKFVAGAGKTTYSEEYMRKNKNGIYLAFNNSVVDELKNKGYLCKTIDALFFSYIIPKFTSAIPLIANGAAINYTNSENAESFQKGMSNIKIEKNGDIYNKGKKTIIKLNIKNEEMHKMRNFPNSFFIKYVFAKDSLNINDQQRAELSYYIIEQYSNEIVELLESRFSYIIIDEAQDLKGYREEFAKLIYKSNIKLILLGDDNQNINGGGKWFEKLKADETKQVTYRCTENVCKWIRNNLQIDIYGNQNYGEYKKIKFSETLNYNDGKRVLLYSANTGKNKEIIENWKGLKETIRKAKGSTIEKDVVIIGESLNRKNLYTAITRTKKNVYSTVSKINY